MLPVCSVLLMPPGWTRISLTLSKSSKFQLLPCTLRSSFGSCTLHTSEQERAVCIVTKNCKFSLGRHYLHCHFPVTLLPINGCLYQGSQVEHFPVSLIIAHCNNSGQNSNITSGSNSGQNSNITSGSRLFPFNITV